MSVSTTTTKLQICFKPEKNIKLEKCFKLSCFRDNIELINTLYYLGLHDLMSYKGIKSFKIFLDSTKIFSFRIKQILKSLRKPHHKVHGNVNIPKFLESHI